MTTIVPVPPAPRPADLDYLFILTYGRSGSTLLQGILNSIPGYLIRGENRQVLRHFWEVDRTLLRERNKQLRWMENNDADGELPVTHAFFGIDGYPRPEALRLTRKYATKVIFRPREDTRVTGFKEIRWAEPDTARYVTWLQRVFPNARFIVNTRNLDDVANSAWWRDDPDARSHLQDAEQQLLDIAGELGESAFRLHYDDYVSDPEQLQGLFRWLGEDFDLPTVQESMRVRHSWPY